MGTLSFGEDQKEVNRSHDAIKECDQNIVEDTVPELTNRTTTREQSHQQCRVAEKEMKGSRDRLCRELQTISSQANPPAFPNRPSTWTSDEVKKFFDAIRVIQSWANTVPPSSLQSRSATTAPWTMQHRGPHATSSKQLLRLGSATTTRHRPTDAQHTRLAGARHSRLSRSCMKRWHGLRPREKQSSRLRGTRSATFAC